MLLKYADKFILAFDGDVLGFKAHIDTTRIINHVLKAHLSVEKIDLKAHITHVLFENKADAGNFLKQPNDLKTLFANQLNSIDFTNAKLQEHERFCEMLQTLKQQPPSQNQQKQQLLEFTVNALHYTLKNTDKGKIAQEMLQELGITSAMLTTHQIGLALKDRTLLASQIKNNSSEMMQLALEMGLIENHDNKLASTITGIIIPFRNEQQQIVGFENFTSKNIELLADNLKA